MPGEGSNRQSVNKDVVDVATILYAGVTDLDPAAPQTALASERKR